MFEAVEEFPDWVDGVIADAVDYHSQAALISAKVHAPWTDRTTNARNGLSVQAYHETKRRHGFVLYHRVPYGIWLEVSNGGRYAIIGPTLARESIDLMETIRQGLG